jgi:hypothetical protein
MLLAGLVINLHPELWMCIHELGGEMLVGGKIQVDSIDIPAARRVSRRTEQRK